MISDVKSIRDSVEYAEEKLVATVQLRLEELMDTKGYSKADLARRMGVSKPRVSQIFSDDQNFTVRLLARAFHALGENIDLVIKQQISGQKSMPFDECFEAYDVAGNAAGTIGWNPMDFGHSPQKSVPDYNELFVQAYQAAAAVYPDAQKGRSGSANSGKALSGWTDSSTVVEMASWRSIANG